MYLYGKGVIKLNCDKDVVILLQFTTSYLIIGIMLTVSRYFQDNSILWTMALLVHSFILSFLFMGLHENVHETAFKSSDLSKMFRNFYGFLTFRPPVHYYYYHWAHHKHTGNKSKDPELFNSMIDMEINGLASSC